jgi:hypothetical protein
VAAPLRWMLVLACALALVARASADAPTVEKALAAAETLFEEQEYAKVVKTLRPVLSDTAATRAQRLRALELTALSHLILGDEAEARTTFERLLDIDPAYQLSDQSGSPRISRFFDEVKKDVVPGFDVDLVAVLDHAAPPEATAGRRLEIDVRATSGADNVKQVVFLWRRRGEQDYRELTAAFRGDARWRVRLTPDASREAYAIEYYVEGRGLTDQTVARVASPEAPLSIAISAGTGTSKKPIYRRWYFWAGIGGAAALATGAVILGTSGPDDGTLPPGRVTVTP